jgi:hypothetical protein
MAKTTVLTAMSLSMDSYISCAFILPMMLASVFFLQLLVYSELYAHSRACYPILYFFGDTTSCQQTIGRIAQNITTYNSLKQTSKNIIFEETMNQVIDGFSNMYNNYNNGMTNAVNSWKQFQKNYYQEMIAPIA